MIKVFIVCLLPPAHSLGRRKCLENPAEVGLLETKPAYIFGCPVHALLRKKDASALSG